MSKTGGNFDRRMSLSPSSKAQLRWWLSEEIHIPRDMFPRPPTMHIYSDASLEGWGAHNDSNRTGGRWSEKEAKNHINWLELYACFLGLKSLAEETSNSTIHVHSDNTSAISYIVNQGGNIASLNNLASDIWNWCKEKNVWLVASHIKGVENDLADNRSRIFHDATEWSLDKKAFSEICHIFGSPDIDLFASRLNNKVANYCSWEPDPHSLHVDAFTVNWAKFDNCYVFPPFNLVGKVIRKLLLDDVKSLILVCPNWPSQPWYPLLKKFKTGEPGIHFHNRKDLLLLPFDRTKTHGIWNKLNLCCYRLSSRR